MFSLQKKLTCPTESQFNDNFPAIMELKSLKRSLQKHSSQSHQRQVTKINYLSPRQTAKRYLQTKEGQKQNGFGYLSINIQMMNRSIKNSAVKNSNSTNLTRLNRLELENKKIKQKKLDKIKKQEWYSTNKKFLSNFNRYDENDQRKIYRPRKKFYDANDDKFVGRDQKAVCLDGVFPISRINSYMLTLHDKNCQPTLVLVGGSSGQMNAKLHFHQYHHKQHLWEQVRHQSPNQPHFNLSQHLILEFKKTIFIIGGIAVIPSLTEQKNQRYSIPFISCFSFKTNKWSRINWSVYLRAHAGTTFGNFGIIDGGVCQDNKNSTKMYLIDLSKSQPPVLVNSKSLGLSYHKLVSTQTLQQKNRSLVKHAGMYCFGGKRQDGSLNDKLYLVNFDYRFHELYDRLGKFEWNIVETSGKSPKPRYMHSMDLLESKTNIFDIKILCAVIGGIGQSQRILNDFWLLDLGSLQWCQVPLEYNNCNTLERGLAGHSTAVIKNQIFILGGYNQTRQYESHFWTINCQKNGKSNYKQNRITKEQ